MKRISPRIVIKTCVWLSIFIGLVIFVLAISFRLAAHQRETLELGAGIPETGSLLETPEGAFFVMSEGNAESAAVLFAHGTAAWSELWHPTLDAIATEGYLATAFDMTPFGWSQHAGDADYSRTRQADRIIALLEVLGTRPIVVAHSVGAAPMSEAILRRPDLVSGYVIVAGAIGLETHQNPKHMPTLLQPLMIREVATSLTASNPLLTGTFLRNFMYVTEAATPERVRFLKEPMAREGYTEAVAAWIPNLLSTPSDALSTQPQSWAQLELPVALIWGDKDHVTPLAQGEALTELIKGATLTVLPDTGHIPQIEAPNRFQTALIDALSVITSSTDQR